MDRHLKNIQEKLTSFLTLKPQDVVIDIGSNDGSFLRHFPEDFTNLYGIDPLVKKFRESYPLQANVIDDFFPSHQLTKRLEDKKAKLITTIAMFYGSNDPVSLAREISSHLAPDGVWYIEQSYLPQMLKQTAYDSICHEHVGYYSLKQMKWILDGLDLQVIKVNFNSTNGGSFSLMISHRNAPYSSDESFEKLLNSDDERKLSKLETYQEFSVKVKRSRDELLACLGDYKSQKKKVAGVGASTKGNVLLQYCGIGTGLIPHIAELNSSKFNHVTPGTHIPIVSEVESKAGNPDVKIILPWHFREHFLQSEKGFILNGGEVVFPLPELEIITKEFYDSLL